MSEILSKGSGYGGSGCTGDSCGNSGLVPVGGGHSLGSGNSLGGGYGGSSANSNAGATSGGSENFQITFHEEFGNH